MTARSPRAGFTFLELLNMVVLGAILATIIVGLRHRQRGPAPDPAIAPMRAALTELRDAQGRYHAQTLHFTTRLDSLSLSPAAGITRQVDRADSISWHGTARKEGSALACSLTVGIPGVVDSVICRTGAP